jgi:predicted DNA-binding transcriptional regulator AlpA
MSKNQQTGRQYLRKRSVAARYGVDIRTVDRMRDDKRIPPPKYLPGSVIPMWDEAELDQNDRRATLTSRRVTAE